MKKKIKNNGENGLNENLTEWKERNWRLMSQNATDDWRLKIPFHSAVVNTRQVFEK